jgi:hypothetical protein
MEPEEQGAIAMSALKLFLSRMITTTPVESDRNSSRRDPLLHPDLEHMSLTELADLPLMPEHLGRAVELPASVKPPLLRCA